MFNLHSLGVEGQEGKGDAGNTTHVTAMFKYEFLSWGPGPAATYVEFHTIGTIPGAFETHGLNYLTIKSLCTPMILEHSLSAKKTQTNICVLMQSERREEGGYSPRPLTIQERSRLAR